MEILMLILVIDCKYIKNDFMGFGFGEMQCDLFGGIWYNSFIKNFKRFLLLRNVNNFVLVVFFNCCLDIIVRICK